MFLAYPRLARLGSLACVIFLPGPVAASEPFRRLFGPEISASLVGRELTDEAHWRLGFEPDGRLTSFSLGRPGTGRWSVQADELCLERGSPPSLLCYEVWAAGRQIELRREPGPPEEGVLVAPGG